MSKGARFALSLILFWLAFVCFYVAFHPGGIFVPGPDPSNPNDTSTTHKAQNPGDVIGFLAKGFGTGDWGGQGAGGSF